nr:ParB/Srx family N-terminal domain-containing protein [Endozoicomonas sp. SESOKO1]
MKACPRNAKKHDVVQVQQIARSIEIFGFNNPVLIDSDGEIIAGHGRFAAAQLLQLEKIPCIVLDHLNDQQKRAFRIADNRLSEQGGDGTKTC